MTGKTATLCFNTPPDQYAGGNKQEAKKRGKFRAFVLSDFML
jgi:hypothetical protein